MGACLSREHRLGIWRMIAEEELRDEIAEAIKKASKGEKEHFV